MKPRSGLTAIYWLALLLLLLGLPLTVALAQPSNGANQSANPASNAAPAPAAPAIKPTACGAPGVGRLVGRAEPVARSASEAAGSYVAEDGYWHAPCPPAPPAPRPPSDCPPAKPDATRTWTAGSLTCTASVPPTDRTIAHGRTAGWMAASGATRGILIEHCADGVRSRVGATCAPATSCSAHLEATRDGRVYVYDAPGTQPLGSRITLRAADGATWPATCVAGSWDVPSVRPGPPKPLPAPHAITTCRAQTSQYDVPDLGRRWISVRQLITPVGDQVVGETVGTPMRRPIPMLCGADGRFTLAPPAAPSETAESGAAEWQRLYEHYRALRR